MKVRRQVFGIALLAIIGAYTLLLMWPIPEKYVTRSEVEEILQQYVTRSEVEVMIQKRAVQLQTPMTTPTPTQPALRKEEGIRVCRLAEFSRGKFTPGPNGRWQFNPECPLPVVQASACLAEKNIVLIGDSKTGRLAKAFLDGASDVLRIGNSESYMGPPVSFQRTFITLKPVKNGAKCGEEVSYFEFEPSPYLKPICKTCSGCKSQLVELSSGGSVEYLAIERLLDYQMPSAMYNTTQENVIEYLGRRKQPTSLVLINAGLHISGYENHTIVRETFRERLIWYLQEMRKTLPEAVIVWVATSHRPRSKNKEGLGIWMNQVAEHVTNQNGIPFLNAHNITRELVEVQPSAVEDSVHFIPDYYQTIRDIIVSWHCSPSKGH